MPRSGMMWEQVVEVASAYPGVIEKSSYGTPALYVGTKFMARLREPGVMVLRPVFDDEQQFLMETSPQAFFLTDHYRGYPTILIRLPKVRRGQLAELIEGCWRQLATKKQLAEHEASSAATRQQTAKRKPRPRTVASK